MLVINMRRDYKPQCASRESRLLLLWWFCVTLLSTTLLLLPAVCSSASVEQQAAVGTSAIINHGAAFVSDFKKEKESAMGTTAPVIDKLKQFLGDLRWSPSKSSPVILDGRPVFVVFSISQGAGKCRVLRAISNLDEGVFHDDDFDEDNIFHEQSTAASFTDVRAASITLPHQDSKMPPKQVTLVDVPVFMSDGGGDVQDDIESNVAVLQRVIEMTLKEVGPIKKLIFVARADDLDGDFYGTGFRESVGMIKFISLRLVELGLSGIFSVVATESDTPLAYNGVVDALVGQGVAKQDRRRALEVCSGASSVSIALKLHTQNIRYAGGDIVMAGRGAYNMLKTVFNTWLGMSRWTSPLDADPEFTEQLKALTKSGVFQLSYKAWQASILDSQRRFQVVSM